MPSYGPFYDPKAKSYYGASVPELTSSYVLLSFRCRMLGSWLNSFHSLFDRRNLLVACDPRLGLVTLWSCAVCRGWRFLAIVAIWRPSPSSVVKYRPEKSVYSASRIDALFAHSSLQAEVRSFVIMSIMHVINKLPVYYSWPSTEELN